MASYVAAYRIGMLVSTAGALFVVTGFESGLGFAKHAAWTLGYLAMALLVLIGIVTTLLATEPEKSRKRQARSTPRRPRTAASRRVASRASARSRISSPASGDRRAGFRHSLQILRRLRRHDDGAVRHRSRFHAQRLRHDRQGRRPCRDADRRLCRRLRRARLAADDLPVDRRAPADRLQPRVRLAGARSAPITGRSPPRSSRRISPARSAP